MSDGKVLGLDEINFTKRSSLPDPHDYVGTEPPVAPSEWADASAASFYVAMLTISLLVGLAYCGFVAYTGWHKSRPLLSYVMSLAVALVCRTFFTLLIASVVLLNGSNDVAGGNALVAFECFSQNLVLSFWLLIAVYLHACVQSNFNSEPSLKIYRYGVPSVGLFFAFIWTFIMIDKWSGKKWALDFPEKFPYLWIVSTFRLLYLFIQVGLVADVGRLIATNKCSLSDCSTTMMRKIAIVLGVLLLLFWLQFGFSVGRLLQTNIDVYIYFEYLIDGLQCALVCPLLYFFEKWGQTILNKIPQSSASAGKGPRHGQTGPEALDGAPSKRATIFTIDSVYSEAAESDRRGDSGDRDVVYSSVVAPEKLGKMFQLYKRLKVVPAAEVTIVAGEEFYECRDESVAARGGHRPEESDEPAAEGDRVPEDEPSTRGTSEGPTYPDEEETTPRPVPRARADPSEGHPWPASMGQEAAHEPEEPDEGSWPNGEGEHPPVSMK